MKRIRCLVSSLLICIQPLTFVGTVGVVATSGCRTLAPGGVYQGDKYLEESELAITTSYDLLHTYVTWEYQNRAALSKWPEIKKSADNIRANSKQWFASAHNLHDAYAANKSEANRTALNTVIGVLRSALTEASKYMAQVAQPTIQP